MLVMAKKASKASEYPSRKNLKYVPVPKAEWERLKEIGGPQDRSVAYMVKLAVREFLTRHAERQGKG